MPFFIKHRGRLWQCACRFWLLLAMAFLCVFGMGVSFACADDALGDVDEPAVSNTTAEDAGDSSEDGIVVSENNDAAGMESAGIAVSDFVRAQKGTDRDIDGSYRGYNYLVGQEKDTTLQLIAAHDYVVCYVPVKVAEGLGLELQRSEDQAVIKELLTALDATQASGSKRLSDYETWYFTNKAEYSKGPVVFRFDQEISGNVYSLVIGKDGSDLTDPDNSNYLKPSFGDFGRLVSYDSVAIVQGKTGIAAAMEFLQNLDWSPLWVSLRTTGIAIVLIFILGLLAAYLCLNISQKAKNICDVIFTIPMVLPPTVCGFILLYLCGRNTGFGQFWINIGFPLIFSPAACVIAAVVVAFPLMYRNALGAFETLDPNMLDAARTLGWSNAKIFIKLMLPLSWSSIAAGTVLAFARALGEFGATLFLAGNYLGVTRTIPIAIYFEWMNGNDEVAWFWTAVIIAFSFVVILFINLWSTRTTKYRKRSTNR